MNCRDTFETFIHHQLSGLKTTAFRSKLTQPVQRWLGGETNTCFARLKWMDMNDFLICSNALKI